MNKTKIPWCDATFNPISGCLHGCEYCYARRIAERFGTLFKGPQPEDEGLTFLPDEPERFYELDEPVRDENGKIEPYPANFYPTLYRYKLDEYKNKSGRNIFVCSMADMFGDFIPDEWIQEVFAACERAPQHNYLFLTKNPKRYIKLAEKGLLPDNHWYGYSVTRQSDLWEFKHASDCPIRNLFVSIEPILEPIKPAFCSHCPADWVIVGAETGHRKGKVIPHREWIEEIVTVCEYSGIPLFMKESLAPIWGEDLIQEFPTELMRRGNGKGRRI